jgi:hypothetical protein
MENQKAKRLLTILSIVLTTFLIIGAGYAGAMKIDNRYMKVAMYVENEIRKIENQIFELELRVHQGDASPTDKAILERLKRQLEAMRQEKDS